ncbi:MAG: sulfatase-like hydrolase/transferase [Verrucomicrobia bacterium]|jgi:arylsulfatase A-like enzyme|nr:sulfatase-like hydrolase/transferase [Verrucomicrobiota bacterium]
MSKKNIRLINAALLVGALLVGPLSWAETNERPNILFGIMDDASMEHMSAYGCTWVDTPAFDRLAREGLLFKNAYTPNAKCAPSRSIVLTGRQSWQLEEAANHVINFPAKFKTLAEALRAHGYATGLTGKGWGPGNPGTIDGQPRLLIGESWNDKKATPPAEKISHEDYAANFADFLDAAAGQPWFFWYGAREPHRRYEFGSGVRAGRSTDEIDVVPPYWPDNEIVRTDMLDYGLEVEHADRHLGQMLEELERRGQLENTIVVMTSDNGMPFPRVKAQNYEASNHMPLAILWPRGIKAPGRIIEDMVSFVDFAPTFLEVAGIPFEASGMHSFAGRSLTGIFESDTSGQVDPFRDFIVLGKERHDYSRPNNEGYPMRAIVGDGFLYIYNYELDRWPAGNPELGYLDVDGSPTKTAILNMRREGMDRHFWELSFGKRSTHEELYHVSVDPHCIVNLADQPAYAERKAAMRKRMLWTLKAQGDPRMVGDGAIFDSYGYSEDRAWNFYERFMAGEFTPETTEWVNPSDYEPAPIK